MLVKCVINHLPKIHAQVWENILSMNFAFVQKLWKVKFDKIKAY